MYWFPTEKAFGRLAKYLPVALVLAACGLASPRPARAAMGDGADIQFGGWGQGHGKFLRQFPVVASPRSPTLLKANPTAGMANFTNNPQRLAVDSAGDIFVTQPWAQSVQEYSPTGQLLRNIPLPYAMAITVWNHHGQEYIAVVGSESATTPAMGTTPAKGWHWVGGNHIYLLNPVTGTLATALKLSVRLKDVQDMATDSQGNFYLEAAIHQLYKFSPQGKLLQVIGAGTSMRRQDGSELYRTVAVGAHGSIYSMTMGGNPQWVTRFNPSLTVVTQRGGQFHWADSWSYPGHRTPMVIDHKDRLWVASTGHRPTPSPVIMRLDKNYLSPKLSSVRVHSALTLGLAISATTDLPYNIGYALAPATADFDVAAAIRRVHNVLVLWKVYDLYKKRIAHGRFSLDLKAATAARQAVSFIPPKWGWYTVIFTVLYQGKAISSTGCDLGFTPQFKGMPILKKGQSPGGWSDPLRQMFCGLPCIRQGIGSNLTGIGKALALDEKYGAKVFCQFTSIQDCTPACVRAAVTKFKTQVHVWEVMNEPNFSMSPAQYVTLIKTIYPIIKSIDPQAKVMGPAVCGIQLPWYKQFLALGGGKYINILSLHDYEGNTSIGPAHWRWKFAALHKLMTQYGCGKLPIWQTERDIGGVRAGLFWGGTQAVRLTLHTDLLRTLGVPNAHDQFYYLNNSGYGAVPSYIWSNHGPFPAALAMRTRQAMILGRKYRGAINFGPSGKRLFLGLRYVGQHGQTIILRNLGSMNLPLNIKVSGGGPVTVVDSFGNRQAVPVRRGRARVIVSAMPVYLRLHAGQRATFPILNFGANDAVGAKFTYSAKNNGLFSTLTGGVFGSEYPGDPTDGKFFIGSLTTPPQFFTITLTKICTINRVLLYSMHADNPYCALLDYNLQYQHGRKWITLEKVRTPCPRSTPVHTGATVVDGWYLDQNFFVNHFKAIRARRLRLVILKTTWGFMPDKLAVQVTHFVANHPHLMLRQVEIYGPQRK